MSALSAQELTYHYGQMRVLDRASVSAAAGELIAIIGPNGAGKTTLLAAIAGVLKPDSGTVSLPPEQIGWVPQQPAVYGKLSARENLEFFAGLNCVPDVPGAVQRMLSQAGLIDRADDPVETLSGGNRQRVNIAVGLLAEPPVLLLDEPASSLDPYQRGRMWEFIGDLAKSGTVVLFTTHDIAEAERHADRVIVLVDGRVVADLPPAELRRQARERSGDPVADLESAFITLVTEPAEGGHR